MCPALADSPGQWGLFKAPQGTVVPFGIMNPALKVIQRIGVYEKCCCWACRWVSWVSTSIDHRLQLAPCSELPTRTLAPFGIIGLTLKPSLRLWCIFCQGNSVTQAPSVRIGMTGYCNQFSMPQEA